MIERIITILASLENGIKAIDRLAYALEQQNEIALTALASSAQRLTAPMVAEQIEAMTEVAAEVAAAEPAQDVTPPAELKVDPPKPAKNRPTKAEMIAKREAAKETVLLAGMRLDLVEKEIGTLCHTWNSAQCEAAELMAAQAAEQAETLAAQPEPEEPVEEEIEEPTLTEDPAEDRFEVPDAGTVRAAVIAYSAVHGKPAARDLIQSVGKAEKLTEVTPENLGALYRAVTQAAA